MPSMTFLQLHLVHDADLLAGLERGQAYERTRGASEGIAQRAVVARARLALHRKVQLVQVARVELDGLEAGVGLGSSVLFLRLELGGQTARAVLAGAAALLWLALGCC